jgi:plastocyanin
MAGEALLKVQRSSALAIVAVLGFTGCGGSSDDHANAPATQHGDQVPHVPPTATDCVTLESLGGTASVRGVVKLTGTPPPREKVTVTGDPICEEAYRERPLQSSDVLVGPDGGLANVFVYVKRGFDAVRFAVPTEPVILDQNACMYVPRVLGLMVGQTLLLRNDDPTLHNVHGLSSLDRKRDFNFGMPRRGTEVPKTFDAPEVMYRMKCDVHPWMAAWIGVLHHPAHDVTDAAGAFELSRLPAGEYEIEAWHERYGTLQRTVVLVDGQAADVEFVFPATP